MSSVKEEVDKQPEAQVSFAETAMRLGGKSEEESTRTGKLDMADDQVEQLFAQQYKTSNSPVHKAVWENETPIAQFMTPKLDAGLLELPVMKKSLEVIQKHIDAKTLMNDKGKITEQVIADLGEAGYWGLFIPQQYGGSGLSVRQFMNFISEVALRVPMLGGLASVHSCIGAVDPIVTFGNEEQKQRYLPKLASGEMISAFGLTEPNAGSDLTALRTTATLKGDKYVLNGEKLFITNALLGRTVCVVALIDGKPAALIVEFPKEESDKFKLVPYGIYAVKQATNQGFIFKDFEVPKENLLVPAVGDGLTIAYHGLNRGRLALCATAASGMKGMLANIIPWAQFRETYGNAIVKRELVQRRIAKTAGLIAGAEALYNWGSWLLDQGYRGELECILAKIFGSEAQKEVAIEYLMKTHGGRSFLHGHPFGDNVHEYLAPCIYEGEGEVLGMAFFKSLAKDHGVRYMEPIGKTLAKHKIKKMNPFNPDHAWKLRNALIPYSLWYAGKFLESEHNPDLPTMNPVLKDHIEFAVKQLHSTPFELTHAMIKHQLKLTDRQCRIADMSERIQWMIIMLVTALWAHQDGDPIKQASADVLCQSIRYKLTGERATDEYYKTLVKLADQIVEKGYPGMNQVTVEKVLFPYSKTEKAEKADKKEKVAKA
ncbi:MAG: acyl-CoA/acyl-ACP dehydrogenase [Candidatus Obscuribacterales bacterium]|nr:acyl-CoA/acyl-ACP dehydrogenase [Candidatus Obscuribacterales bacterium]